MLECLKSHVFNIFWKFVPHSWSWHCKLMAAKARTTLFNWFWHAIYMYQFKANKWTVEKYGKKSIMEYCTLFMWLSPISLASIQLYITSISNAFNHNLMRYQYFSKDILLNAKAKYQILAKYHYRDVI